VSGQTCYLWAAIDVDTNEVLAVYASRGRGIPSAIKFLRKVLDSCEGKPVIVVDRGPWYRWALDRLGITCFHETLGKRNRIERWFREMKNRTKRFYNNINAKTLKSPRRAGNYNCSNAQHHQGRMRRGITNLTVPVVDYVNFSP
jgi:putative transposase